MENKIKKIKIRVVDVKTYPSYRYDEDYHQDMINSELDEIQDGGKIVIGIDSFKLGEGETARIRTIITYR
jgi:hypothetical protein